MTEENTTDLFSTTAEVNPPAGSQEEEDLVIDLGGEDLKTQRREPLPVGTWVQVVIYEASVGKVSKEGDNKGKPFYKLQFKPLPHEIEKHSMSERKLFFENFMLFSGAFFNAKKLLDALGFPTGNPKAGEQKLQVPHPDKLIGLELEAKVTKHQPSNRTDDDGNPFINEVLGAFRPLQEADGDEAAVSDEAADLFSTGASGSFS